MKMRTHTINGEGAFTLVELLVVIAIIAILSAIITANFTSAKSKSRDAKRVSDIAQIQLAIAGFFDRCNAYPPTLDTTATVSMCPTGVTLGTFISRIPSPPNTSEVYNYVVDTAPDSMNNPKLDDYFLQATLENSGSTSNNSMIGFPSSFWYPGTFGGGTIPVTSVPSGTLTCDAALNYCVGPK